MHKSNIGLTFADYIDMKPVLEHIMQLVQDIPNCNNVKERQRLDCRLCELSEMVVDRIIYSFEVDNSSSYFQPRTDYSFDDQGNIIRA